jgi:ribosomal protein S18 acetylase RimI-like enzyme
MAEVELLPVGPEHEDAMLELARSFHAEDGHPLTERGEAAIGMIAKGHPLGRAWLVHEAGRLIGYAVLGLGFGIEYGGPDAFVDDLYLVPEARGRGLGGLVLAQLEDEAQALGLAALFLVVDPENLPARRLYDRVGFGSTHWLLMAKRLQPAEGAGSNARALP